MTNHANNTLYARSRHSGTTWTDWQQIAYTDGTIANATNATNSDKLGNVDASKYFSDAIQATIDETDLTPATKEDRDRIYPKSGYYRVRCNNGSYY